jgi:GNAT superfamily N-acetyltransferase
VEHTAPGRYAEVISPTPEQIAATLVLAFPIAEGSAKVRSGPPIDPAELAEGGRWGGVLPLALQAGTPRSDGLDSVPPELAASVRTRARGLGLGPRTPYERREGELLISTDPRRLDLAQIHQFLCHHSYWAQGVSEEAVRRSCAEALCFGVYRGTQQLAFARVVSDFSRIAYLGDVFVREAERGQGLGKLLVAEILAHPELARVERWLLGTRDAHRLYTRFGFVEAPAGRYMAASPR